MEPEEFEKRDTHLVDHLWVIWRRKSLVVLVAVGVFGWWMWGTLREQPVYESVATIQLGSPSGSVALERFGPFAANSIGVESEIGILRSRMIAERTAVRLQRHFTLLPLPPGVSLEVAGVAITDIGRPGVYTVAFPDETGQYQVTDPEGRLIGVGRPGQAFGAGGVSFTISDVTAKPGSSVQILLRTPAAVADALRSGLSVAPIGGTNIVSLKVRASDPQETARLANAFAETYVDFTRQQRVQHVFSTRQFLDEQIEPLRKELHRSEQALTEHQASVGLLGPGSGLNQQVNRITDAEITREKLALQRREAEGILDLLRRGSREGSEGPVIWTIGVTDPMVEGLTSRLSELESQRATLRQTYTARHRLVVQLDREIAEIRNRLAEQLQATINGLTERERLLTQDIRQYKAELSGLPPSELRLLELVREAQVKAGIYTYLLERQQEARVAEASERGGASIIDRALPSGAPIGSNVPRKAVSGGVFGLALGIGLALLVNYLDRSVKNVKDLQDRTGLPAFGVIPEISDGSRRSLVRLQKQRGGPPDPRKLVGEISRTMRPAAEAYRALRTNIQFAAPGMSARAFLFTSAGPGEGKTLTVANLAIVLSQMGGRILVVDADLRRPAQHTLFPSEGEVGLSDVLARNLAWREVTRLTRVQNLDLIPCGHIPPNPVELLGSRAMKAFLEEAKRHYDLILLDSSPALPFTDACVVAPLVDGVFLIVRAGQTNPEAIARVQSLLGAVEARVVGAILNATPSADEFEPYGYRYSRYYAYYYKDEQTSGEGDRGWLRRIRRRILSRTRR